MKKIAVNTSDLHCEIYNPLLHVESDGWEIIEVEYELPAQPWTLKNGKVVTWVYVKPREEMTLDRAEFFARLIKKGIIPDSIEENLKMISDATQRTLALNDFRNRGEVRRMSSLLISMASQYGFTAEQLDELFS